MYENFNLNLACEVIAVIDMNKEFWRQDEWARCSVEPPTSDLIVDRKTGEVLGSGTCGTALCVAGWAVTLSGDKLVWEFAGENPDEPDEENYWVASWTTDGEHVPDRAAELLGIPIESFTAMGWPRLFNPHNDRSDLITLIAEYAGRDESEVEVIIEAKKAGMRDARKARQKKGKS